MPALVAGAAVLLFAVLIGHTVRMRGFLHLLQSDAPYFYLVATDPFGTGDALRHPPASWGDGADGTTAYRYGRIGYPLLAWVLALGQPAWVRVTFPLAYLAGIGLLVGVLAAWAQRAGRSPWIGLVALAPLGLLVPGGRPYLVPEALYSGLILTVYYCDATDRRRGAYLAAACLLLTRETTILALAPLGLQAVRARRWREVTAWSLAGLPLLLWHGWVRARVGAWPLVDPAMQHTQPYDLPVRGFLAQLTSPDPSVRCVVLIAWATLLVAWTLAGTRRTALAIAAATFTSVVIVFGPGQAGNPVEALRLLVPMQILIVAAILTRPRAGAPAYAGAAAGATLAPTRGGRDGHDRPHPARQQVVCG